MLSEQIESFQLPFVALLYDLPVACDYESDYTANVMCSVSFTHYNIAFTLLHVYPTLYHSIQ